MTAAYPADEVMERQKVRRTISRSLYKQMKKFATFAATALVALSFVAVNSFASDDHKKDDHKKEEKKKPH